MDSSMVRRGMGGHRPSNVSHAPILERDLAMKIEEISTIDNVSLFPY